VVSLPFRIDPFQVFLQKYHVRKFDKGELILVQGEAPECAYVIKKGVVETYNLTSQGEEKPINYDIQGEIFPLAWVFGQIRTTNYYYEAFTKCELYCVPREDYKRFIAQSTGRLMGVLEAFIAQHLNSQLRVNALEQSKASAKVLYTLHFLCLRYGEDIKKNVVRIQIPLTQQDMANFMGLTRETTGIELKKLQRSGLITYRRQNYIVRTDRLNEILDEEYDHNRLQKQNVRIRI
jgi:CRP-like cAMP-binding protein